MVGRAYREAYARVGEDLPQEWVEPFKLKCVMIFDTRSKRESYLRCLRYLPVKKLCLCVLCVSVVILPLSPPPDPVINNEDQNGAEQGRNESCWTQRIVPVKLSAKEIRADKKRDKRTGNSD